jgi:hypothetical protein
VRHRAEIAQTEEKFMRNVLLAAVAVTSLACVSDAKAAFPDVLSDGFQIGNPNVFGEVIVKVRNPAIANKVNFADVAAWQHCHVQWSFAVKYFLVNEDNVLQPVEDRRQAAGPQTCQELDAVLSKP